MARVNKVQACMFCEQVPCQCNAKPKPEKKKREPKAEATPTATPEAAPKPDPWMEEAPKRRGPFEGFVHPSQALRQSDVVAAQQQHLIEVAHIEAEAKAAVKDEHNAALAVIRDARILAPADQAKVERIVPREYHQQAVQRVIEWRERHASQST